MINPDVEKIIEVTKAKKIGNSWQGHCPAHNDKNPSLSINRSNNGKVLVKCHGGCEQRLVVDALKTLKAWPNDGLMANNKKIEYFYEDQDTGTKSLKVIRTDRPDGTKKIYQQYLLNGEWINGGAKTPLYPYRYSKWQQSTNKIYIVEGEKCVHALENIGLDATTFVGGSNGWRVYYADYFVGREVIILPDNDSPGLKYANEISIGLQNKAKSIKVVNLPELKESEDIFDWIQSGHTLEELENLVSNTPESFNANYEVADSWQTPKPLLVSETTPLDTDCLPAPLAEYVKELSTATETPTDLAITVALGVVSLASAISFKVEVKDGYLEPLNLYLLSALESGNRKTSIMNACLEPLIAFEIQARESEKQLIYEARYKKRNQDAELKNLRNKLGAKNDKPQSGIIERIKELEMNPIEVPKFTRLICSDTTPEALASVMSDNKGIIGIFSDEGGIFQILGGRYSGQIPNLDLVLKSHIGSAYRIDRKNSDPIIMNEPLISMALAPQPSVIRNMSKTPEFRERGLFARFLFTIPQSPLGKRTDETVPISEATKSAYSNLILRLLSYRQLSQQRIILKLSEPALAAWQTIWKNIESYIAIDGPLSNAKDWGSKLPGHIARIAAIFHCIEHSSSLTVNTTIEPISMFRAEGMIQPLISHALQAFELLKPDPTRDLAEKILDWMKLETLHVFTQRDCHHRFKSSVKSVKDILPSLKLLSDHNYIKLKPQELVSHRPSKVYEVNPKVHL